MEQNYTIYNRELLAILRALRKWRHYILDSGFTTTVHLDHQNLLYYHILQKLFPRQAHWAIELSEYDIALKHVPGIRLVQVDNLT